jgi:hypothetical protein
VAVQIKQLRILSAVLLGFAIGQAGLGSGYVGGGTRTLLIAHATNAFAVFVLTALSAIFGFNYRRAGGPGWVFFVPLAMLVMVGIQITLGFAGIRGAAGIRGIHVFWGVLYLCAATAFCSNIWRHRPTAAAQSTAGTVSGGR